MPGTASFPSQQTDQGAPSDSRASDSRDKASDSRVNRESGSFDTAAYGHVVATQTIMTKEEEIKAEHMKMEDEAGSRRGDYVPTKQEEGEIPLAHVPGPGVHQIRKINWDDYLKLDRASKETVGYVFCAFLNKLAVCSF